MDTEEFLDIVLPASGRRCVGVLNNGYFANYYGGSNHWVTQAVDRINAKGVDAYFACAGFGPDKNRTQANVVALKSFWLDIDTQEGKPGETYADRKEALTNALAFAGAVGLPSPLVVSSGYGIHCYWPTDADMDPEAWKLTATLLKQATKKYGLAVDQSRTADSASVLRPVGARNYKHSTSRPVKVVLAGSLTTHAMLHMKLEAFVGTSGEDGLPAGAAPASLALPGDNSDLMTRREFLPSSAMMIADKCAAMAHVRDTKGNVSEPYWHSALGILVHTSEGDALAHEWSNGHPSYSESETQSRLDRVRAFGPTTCERMSDFSAACVSCPFWGKITSPIVLGVDREAAVAAAEPTTDTIDVVDPVTKIKTKQPLPVLPFPYRCGQLVGAGEGEGTFIWRDIKIEETDPDGTVSVKADRKIVSDVLFYPVARVRSTDDLHSMNVRLIDNQGRQSEFLLDHGLVAEASKTLYAELGRREVNLNARNKPEISGYLSSWITKLRDEHAATPSIEQYGWFKEGFVLGQEYITAKGNRKAILNSSAAKFEEYFHAKGDLETWVQAVDRAYNHPGQEGLQFCVLLSFAAPLWTLFGDNGGVTVYAHSAGSGYGKTTAQQVGLSAWGYYPELVLRESNFTEGALYQHIGVMKNLPVIIDEMTNCSNDFASKLVYNMSAGKGKSRLTSDATMKKPLNWSTIAAASGNNLLTEKLSLHRANAEAEMARVWEFTITKKGTLDPNEALELFGTFSQHYGKAGREFMKYVVENLDEVKALLHTTRSAFNTQQNIQQAERFWSALHACVLSALVICRQLGLLKFSSAAMLAWIGTELEASRAQMSGSVSDPLEQFGDMLSDLWSGILVTAGEGNIANGVHAVVLGHPKTAITGRSILPDTTSQEKLLISVGAAKAWCNKHGVSFKEMHEALVNAKWADRIVRRVSLGKGTEQYSGLGGPVKCWDVNPSAVRSVMGAHPIAQKVHRVITGVGSQDVTDAGAGTH